MKNQVTKYKKKATAVTKNAKNTAIEKAKQSADYVTKNPKTVLYVLGGLAVVYVGYKVVSNLGNVTDSLGDVFSGDKDIDNNVDGTGGSTTNATITNQEAINYAQQLLDAFNAKRPLAGTDVEAVSLVFDKLKNGADFIKVYNAFGTKDYNGFHSPITGFWSWIDSYDKENLIVWIKSEISDSSALYQKIKKIVEQAGFVF